MGFIKRNQFQILILGVIFTLFFLLRLPNLTLQPIFADEAIYIRWAQVMRAEPTLRFLPLTDGKTPLFMWMMIPFLKIFDDPLFAGRFLSLISGLTTLIGVIYLGSKVFGIRVGMWAGFLYVITPYTVFFDRMALVDSMLASFSIWSLIFAVLLLKTPRLDLSFILGFLLGGGLLVKTPAMVNLLILPLTILGFNFRRKEPVHFQKVKKYQLLKLLMFWLIAVAIAVGMYNSLRLGPGFQMLSLRNADYVFSPTEVIKRPLDPLIPHLKDFIDWSKTLLGLSIGFAIILGIFKVFVLKSKLGIVIFLWSFIPLILLMIFLKTFTARYLLFTIPPLLIIASLAIDKIASKNKYLILALLVLAPYGLFIDYKLITDPPNAPLPKEERRGYLEDWTAGYGFPEIAQFLLEQKKLGPVVVGTEGYFGTLPEGLQIYLDKADIPIIGGQATVSAQIRSAAVKNQTFFVANQHRMGNNIEGLEIIKQFPKAIPRDGRPQDAIILYKVLSPRDSL